MCAGSPGARGGGSVLAVVLWGLRALSPLTNQPQVWLHLQVGIHIGPADGRLKVLACTSWGITVLAPTKTVAMTSLEVTLCWHAAAELAIRCCCSFSGLVCL